MILKSLFAALQTFCYCSLNLDCSSILFSQDMSEFLCLCPWNLVIDNFVLGFEKKKLSAFLNK
jgi:hypothetical protein